MGSRSFSHWVCHVIPALLYSHPEHTFVFLIILLAATKTVDNSKASSLCLFNSTLQPHYELHLILWGQKVALWLHEYNQLKRKEKVTILVNMNQQLHSLTRIAPWHFADTCSQIWLILTSVLTAVHRRHSDVGLWSMVAWYFYTFAISFFLLFLLFFLAMFSFCLLLFLPFSWVVGQHPKLTTPLLSWALVLTQPALWCFLRERERDRETCKVGGKERYSVRKREDGGIP